MTTTIVTKSNKTGREIELKVPELLKTETVSQDIEILGEEVAHNKIQNQCTIDFRAKVRGLLESETDGEPTYSDEEIQAMDFSDWKPEARTRKSIEEKAAEIFGKMDLEQVKAALAKAGIDL